MHRAPADGDGSLARGEASKGGSDDWKERAVSWISREKEEQPVKKGLARLNAAALSQQVAVPSGKRLRGF